MSLLWMQVWYEPPIERWQAMEIGEVTVWYVVGHEGLARSVGIWGSDAYRELTTLLEFQPGVRFVLRLHPSPYNWVQTPPFNPQGMLLPPSPIVSVYPLPTRAATAAFVRSEVFASILYHLYFSEGMRVQNRSLLYLPHWFLWGFAYFWGEGWLGEDLARLQGFSFSLLEDLARRSELPSPFYKSLYKSIWYWLYRTYGQRKIIDLLYMTRLTRSISEALHLTLNLSEEELWEKWQEFLRSIGAYEEVSTENEVERRSLIAAAVSSDEEIRAFATLREGKVLYFLRLQGQIYELPGAWSWKLSYYDPVVSMSFSPQNRLVWTSYERQGLILWRWSREAQRYEKYPLSVLALQGLSWESEDQLLFSGLSSDGQVRLYSFSMPKGELRVVGEATGDLLYPKRWKGRLYAVWQPDTSRLAPLSVLWEPFRPVYKQETGWQALPYPSFYSIEGGWIDYDTLLITVSDVNGMGHPWHFTMDTSYPAVWQLDNIRGWAGISSSYAYFLKYRGGRLRLAKAPLSSLLKEGAVFPSLAAAEIVQLRLQRRTAYLGAYTLPPSLPLDTSKVDTPTTERHPFYLFDEEVGRPPRRKSRSRLFPERPSKTTLDIPSSRALGAVPYHWILWDFRSLPVFHPLIRLGWQVDLRVRDWHGDHEWGFVWRPYLDLRSSELRLSYTRHRSRLQPLAELYKQSHFFPARRYQYTLRITTWQGSLGLRYPLTPFFSLEGRVTGLLSNRYHMGRVGDMDLSRQSRWLGGAVQLTYKRLAEREGFIWKGWRGTLRGEAYRWGIQWSYPLVGTHIERFQPLFERVVFHFQGIAMAGGMQGRYFLLGGVPQWVNYEFENRDQVPLLTEPAGYLLTEYVSIPGFPYQARRGRQLLCLSTVARFPLLAWRREPHLPMRPLYNFEWQIGYYIGTVWTTGNPFSQKNPIDAEYIYRPPLVISVQTLKSPFLMSIGTGAVFHILRFPLAAEVYWPIEEGRIQRAAFIVSFKQNL
ncbi:MAG: hypothetical protein RMK19_03630 [Bacteroidia bacterium]|nr:hypothetical protein [Bacteroidia bacterium]MDW8015081.1 hypothetical protein [Bacteroidia bacterium]